MFPPRPAGDGSFAERMTVRFSALAPINDPASLYKPIRKVIHRGHPEIRVTRGNHALVDSPFAPLRGWFPIEVFHFPLRSPEQCAHKAELQGKAFEQIDRAPTAYHANMFAALKSGTIGEYYDSLVVPDEEVERGVETGRLVVDTRLRDALRQLEASGGPLSFPLPTLVEDADLRGRGRGARRGRRRPPPAPPGHARAAPPDARAAAAESRLPEALAERRSARSGAALDRANPDRHLVQPVARVELLRPQVRGGEAVEERRSPTSTLP